METVKSKKYEGADRLFSFNARIPILFHSIFSAIHFAPSFLSFGNRLPYDE